MNDWNAIKLDYVTGIYDASTNLHSWPIAKDLSDKYDVSLDAVKTTMVREGWVQLRKEYQDTCYQESLNRAIDERAMYISELNEVCIRLASKALANIFGLFLSGEEDVALQAVKQYSKQVLDYQRIGRLALSLPTEIKDASLALVQLKAEIDSNTASMSIDELRQALQLPPTD